MAIIIIGLLQIKRPLYTSYLHSDSGLTLYPPRYSTEISTPLKLCLANLQLQVSENYSDLTK